MNEIKVNDKVRRVNSDYEFIGTVVSVFEKTSGLVRYVVEDDRGVLFIWNRENMELVSPDDVPAGLGVQIITPAKGSPTIEVVPEIIEGIVAIGKEIMDLSRHCGTGEMIEISIDARHKLQLAAEKLELMDRIIEEADRDCNNTWRKKFGHPQMGAKNA